MQVEFSTTKATFWDRLVAAYHGFRLEVRPDLKIISDQLDQAYQSFEEKRAAAMAGLDPIDRASIDSIAHATVNWRELLGYVIVAIETLDPKDQITIMRYVYSGNRVVVTDLAFKQWLQRHIEDVLDNFPE